MREESMLAKHRQKPETHLLRQKTLLSYRLLMYPRCPFIPALSLAGQRIKKITVVSLVVVCSSRCFSNILDRPTPTFQVDPLTINDTTHAIAASCFKAGIAPHKHPKSLAP
jgi:hypothetical protein